MPGRRRRRGRVECGTKPSNSTATFASGHARSRYRTLPTDLHPVVDLRSGKPELAHDAQHLRFPDVRGAGRAPDAACSSSAEHDLRTRSGAAPTAPRHDAGADRRVTSRCTIAVSSTSSKTRVAAAVRPDRSACGPASVTGMSLCNDGQIDPSTARRSTCAAACGEARPRGTTTSGSSGGTERGRRARAARRRHDTRHRSTSASAMVRLPPVGAACRRRTRYTRGATSSQTPDSTRRRDRRPGEAALDEPAASVNTPCCRRAQRRLRRRCSTTPSIGVPGKHDDRRVGVRQPNLQKVSDLSRSETHRYAFDAGFDGQRYGDRGGRDEQDVGGLPRSS